MKAIVITKPGGPEVLEVQEYPMAALGAEDVLIEVMASGLNRADIFQREGLYPAPPGVPNDIPGLEISGIVRECGSEVTMWNPGDAVCALIAGGGYAQYVVTKEGQCMVKPEGLSFVEAAALVEVSATVWSNVFQRGRLNQGENFLVHGGNSGIGTGAIQLAKAYGAKVFATVGSEEKGRACLALGADRFINYKTQDFSKELAGVGVDVILDMVGGEYLAKNIAVLREDGRLVYINAVAGNLVPVNLHQIMVKRLTITGSTIRVRDYGWRKALSWSIVENVWPLIGRGIFRPVIYKVYPYTEVVGAHKLMERNQHTGKIMLSWG